MITKNGCDGRRFWIEGFEKADDFVSARDKIIEE